MTEKEKDNREDEATSSQSESRLSLKRLSYLISIVVGFVIPVFGLFRILWKHIPFKPLIVAFIITSILGCGWSNYVSSQRWWEFGAQFLTGIRIFPNLPLEEFLFNPLGGLISVLLYLWGTKYKTKTSQAAYWTFTLVGTAVFSGIAWYTKDNKPYYLYSQLVLFNFICSIFLGIFSAKDINLIGLGLSIGTLTLLGFGWDYIGFKYGWWTYFAITKINVTVVPIEEFNFFLFAPTAAVSVYVTVCKAMKSTQFKK